MHQGVYQVVLIELTLHPLPGAGHGGLHDLHKLSITRDGGKNYQEGEDDTNNEAPHGDEKLGWSWTGALVS